MVMDEQEETGGGALLYSFERVVGPALAQSAKEMLWE